MLQLVKVFIKGDFECNHHWIYDEFSRVYFTTPQTTAHKRVCEKCGRLEEVMIQNKQVNIDKETFTRIINQQ